METITKKELIDRIAEITQAKRVVVKRIIQSFLDELISELTKGNRFEFRDFGIFENHTRAAHTGQNPKTLRKVAVPTKRIVTFKMGRILKQKMVSGA
jgi:integration host factor subunit beta